MNKNILLACITCLIITTFFTVLSKNDLTDTKEIITQKPVIQETFAIIKPDAVEAGDTGAIINLIELNGFTIVDMKKKTLTKQEAETFYAVHKKRPFFRDLVAFMTSGPVVIMKLKRENAITAWRELMGSTNPRQAHVGTIRAMFGTDVQQNATHGSDSEENAVIELSFFFPNIEKAIKKTS